MAAIMELALAADGAVLVVISPSAAAQLQPRAANVELVLVVVTSVQAEILPSAAARLQPVAAYVEQVLVVVTTVQAEILPLVVVLYVQSLEKWQTLLAMAQELMAQ